MKQNNRIAVSDSFCEMVGKNVSEKKIEADWREGLVVGNGRNGAVCSCAPYDETIIYQNIDLLMPTREPRVTPVEVTAQLEEARQAVIHYDASWNVHDRKRTFLYRYHPVYMLRVWLAEKEPAEYRRWTDYEQGMVKVRYRDEDGVWERETFTSRADDVTVTKLSRSEDGTKLDAVLSIDDLSGLAGFGNGKETEMEYKKLADCDEGYLGIIAHYPAYEGSELAEGGYAGISRILTVGGTTEKISLDEKEREAINVGVERQPGFHFKEADAIYIITKADRTHHMGKLEDFSESESWEIVSRLLEEINGVIGKYTDAEGSFLYEEARKQHILKHREIFDALEFSLGDTDAGDASNEQLLREQRTNDELLDALIERTYAQGRYAMICNSGSSAPRLCGLWTGEWNPGWSGAYTMDANVNIQVSGMNTGHISEMAVGYIHFILKQIDDWEDNARMTYGMKDAIQVPVNTDGDVAVMVEYDHLFPFEYWNAGASWMLLPIFEYWQCCGNVKVPLTEDLAGRYGSRELSLEREILLPLLRKQANFWEQLCTPEYYMDREGNARYQKGKKELNEGERYLIIPSYSPENMPLKYESRITANAAMDIAAARDGLRMLNIVLKDLAVKGWEEETERWDSLAKRLPEYMYDDTGALREWSMKGYEENNAHRHISHLYCAWPAYETQKNGELARACEIALENRNRENAGIDDTASHGWIHKALVEARLKHGDEVYEILRHIASSGIFFSSLMTHHNTDDSRAVYCTDTLYGIIGIVNEMLIYSDEGVVEILPALPSKWKKGSVKGILARTRAEITELTWDIEKGEIYFRIISHKVQDMEISCGLSGYELRDVKGRSYKSGERAAFEENEDAVFYFVKKNENGAVG